MEWQTNALTPHILMPSETTKAKFKEILSDKRRAYPGTRPAMIAEFAIQSLADFFDVSVVSAKIRLAELGFEFVEEPVYMWMVNTIRHIHLKWTSSKRIRPLSLM